MRSSRATIQCTLLIFCISAGLIGSPSLTSASFAFEPPAPQQEHHTGEAVVTALKDNLDLESIADAASDVRKAVVAVEDLITGAAPSAGSFIRVNHGEDGEPLALETAIARYVPAIGGGDLIVDLIGVVHFGDMMYYQGLNNRFMQYDALLYELVAPTGTIPGTPRESDVFNKILRKAAVLFCDLESQLAQIDYTRANFVHADLSPQGIAEAMAERGENRWTMLLGITADLIRNYNLNKRQMMQGYGSNPAPAQERINWKQDWKLYFLDPAGFCRVRRLLASQLANTSVTGLGQTIEQILIDDRNKEVINIFEREVINGKRHIGIFYGAAHMEDMEKRLMSRFGLKRESVEWVPAWSLQMRQRTPVEVVFKMMRP